jgi:hypothetical protein
MLRNGPRASAFISSPNKAKTDSRVLNNKSLDIVQGSGSASSDTASQDPVLVVFGRLNARPRTGPLPGVGIRGHAREVGLLEIVVERSEIDHVVPRAVLFGVIKVSHPLTGYCLF